MGERRGETGGREVRNREAVGMVRASRNEGLNQTSQSRDSRNIYEAQSARFDDQVVWGD